MAAERNRDYKRERLLEKPERRKKRALRNKARRLMMRKGKATKGDGKDVDHIKALRNGGTTTPSNIRLRSAKANRADNGGTGGRPKKPKAIPRSSRHLKR
jgi:hypothetical protein